MAARKKVRRKKMSEKAPDMKAVPEKTAPDINAEAKIAVFAVGNEQYAFPLESIIETLYSFEVTRVAHLPDVFAGIVNLRGKSLPVVSLCDLFKIDRHEETTPVCVIVRMNGDYMGFLVDSDIEIVPEHTGTRHVLPDCYTAEEGEFIDGIFWLEQRFIGILNPRRMMEILAGWRNGDEKK